MAEWQGWVEGQGSGEAEGWVEGQGWAEARAAAVDLVALVGARRRARGNAAGQG